MPTLSESSTFEINPKCWQELYLFTVREIWRAGWMDPLNGGHTLRAAVKNRASLTELARRWRRMYAWHCEQPLGPLRPRFEIFGSGWLYILLAFICIVRRTVLKEVNKSTKLISLKHSTSQPQTQNRPTTTVCEALQPCPLNEMWYPLLWKNKIVKI